MTRKKTDFKTKGEARVAIAKDVLKWIDAEEIDVAQSEYVFVRGLITHDDITENTDLRKKLKRERKSCQVCALGAAFLAAVDRFNKVGCSDLINMDSFRAQQMYGEDYLSRLQRGSITTYLKKYFTDHQMNMIEAAFEQTTCMLNVPDSRELDKAVTFSEGMDDYWNPPARLKRIMQNVVDNKGTFVP